MVSLRFPPSPGIKSVLLGLRAFGKDSVFGFASTLTRRDGPALHMKVGTRHVVFVARPDLIAEVLSNPSGGFDKRGLEDITTTIFGAGQPMILMPKGSRWQRKHDLAAGAFRRAPLERFAAIAERRLGGLDRDLAGPVNVSRLILGYTTGVLVEFLTGLTAPVDGVALHAAKYQLILRALARYANPLIPPPRFDPFVWRSRAAIHDAVRHLIAAHMEAPPEDVAQTYLGQLIAAQGLDRRAALRSPELLADLLGMISVGSDPADKVIAWTLSFLARHPEWQERVRREHLATSGPAHEAQRPVLRSVLREVLRLTTPYGLLSRTTIAPVALGEYRLPAGTIVICLPHVAHTDARYWSEPERFRPERFERVPDPAGYFPFGVGERACLGGAVVMPFASLVVTRLVERYTFGVGARTPSLRFRGTMGPAEDIELGVKHGPPRQPATGASLPA